MSELDPPAELGDRTIIRPNPGGRLGGSRPASEAAGAGGPVLPDTSPRAPSAITAISGHGLNPLMQAAAPLLLLTAGLRGARAHADVPELHARVVRQINEFQQQAEADGIAPESLLVARYALCTFLDEAVMNTPWGSQSVWASKPLLLLFHKDTGGGEKFFQLVERGLAEQEPRRALLELFYVCLALGFEGKFRVLEGGQTALAEVRERLYSRIRLWRGESEQALSPHWRGVEDRRYRLVRSVPAWVFLALAGAVASGAFLIFHSLLNQAAAPVLAELNTVKQATFESPSGPPAALPQSRLPTLLAGAFPDKLLVEEEAGRIRLTLLGHGFASGSAHLDSAYGPVLDRIAAALNKVTGRIQVVGHTDDLPIHSLRFKDNYELSRQRALNAAERLKAGLAAPTRVSYLGKGSDQPRYTPASTPENRAKNRRIEILFQPERGASS